MPIVMTELMDVPELAQQECGSEIGDAFATTNNGILRQPCSIVCEDSRKQDFQDIRKELRQRAQHGLLKAPANEAAGSQTAKAQRKGTL